MTLNTSMPDWKEHLRSPQTVATTSIAKPMSPTPAAPPTSSRYSGVVASDELDGNAANTSKGKLDPEVDEFRSVTTTVYPRSGSLLRN